MKFRGPQALSNRPENSAIASTGYANVAVAIVSNAIILGTGGSTVPFREKPHHGRWNFTAAQAAVHGVPPPNGPEQHGRERNRPT
jgi:hypothetical protein